MERHAGEVTSQERAKPCRACTDFKSWVHIQKSKPLVDEQSNKRNTRVEEVKVAEQVQSSPTAELHSMVEVNIQEEKRKECPLDKDELGGLFIIMDLLKIIIVFMLLSKCKIRLFIK